MQRPTACESNRIIIKSQPLEKPNFNNNKERRQQRPSLQNKSFLTTFHRAALDLV
jgi:hypothetical protein